MCWGSGEGEGFELKLCLTSILTRSVSSGTSRPYHAAKPHTAIPLARRGSAPAAPLITPIARGTCRRTAPGAKPYEPRRASSPDRRHHRPAGRSLARTGGPSHPPWADFSSAPRRRSPWQSPTASSASASPSHPPEPSPSSPRRARGHTSIRPTSYGPRSGCYRQAGTGWASPTTFPPIQPRPRFVRSARPASPAFRSPSTAFCCSTPIAPTGWTPSRASHAPSYSPRASISPRDQIGRAWRRESVPRSPAPELWPRRFSVDPPLAGSGRQ